MIIDQPKKSAVQHNAHPAFSLTVRTAPSALGEAGQVLFRLQDNMPATSRSLRFTIQPSTRARQEASRDPLMTTVDTRFSGEVEYDAHYLEEVGLHRIVEVEEEAEDTGHPICIVPVVELVANLPAGVTGGVNEAPPDVERNIVQNAEPYARRPRTPDLRRFLYFKLLRDLWTQLCRFGASTFYGVAQ